jgi:hypothetical protein
VTMDHSCVHLCSLGDDIEWYIGTLSQRSHGRPREPSHGCGGRRPTTGLGCDQDSTSDPGPAPRIIKAGQLPRFDDRSRS